uniref:Uncharacterized protein n=1 Tax=Arundo donax TaxID=35708 RepID=A0A0A9HPY9_ARUDO
MLTGLQSSIQETVFSTFGFQSPRCNFGHLFLAWYICITEV